MAIGVVFEFNLCLPSDGTEHRLPSDGAPARVSRPMGWSTASQATGCGPGCPVRWDGVPPPKRRGADPGVPPDGMEYFPRVFTVSQPTQAPHPTRLGRPSLLPTDRRARRGLRPQQRPAALTPP